MDVTLNYYPGGKKKAITMSYDDGTVYDRELVTIFNRYGIKGTFHLNSSRIGKDGYVNWEEIRKIYAGHEVALHTHTHPQLSYIPNERIVEEVMENRRQLEKCVGYVVNGMSYPMAGYDERVVRQIRECGVVYSRTTGSTGNFSLPDDFMKWDPTFHHSRGTEKWSPDVRHSHTALLEKAKEFLAYPEWIKTMPLLYIWGHSYEFEKDNTWDVIENFAEYVSGAESVWFATNIEIYRYITAMRGLRFSADCTMVYNPSAISVWIGVDDVPVEIKSGKTVFLNDIG